MVWIYQSWGRRTLIGMSVGVASYALAPVFLRAQEPGGRRTSCQSNLKQLGLAFVMYEQDYDQRYPPVVAGGSAYGWADAIYPYVKSPQIYQCPAEQNGGASNSTNPDPREAGYTDYPFNVNLDGKQVSVSPDLARQIVLLDGNDGREATTSRYCLTQIPPMWFSDENSPLYRHQGAANYLFADGHVKAITPAQLGGTNGTF